MQRQDVEEKAQKEWRLRSASFPTQQALLAAIRRGEESAFKELFVVYVPICREEARRLGVSEGYRDTIVYTVLDDVAMRLAETALPPPALTTYVVNALRNRVRTEYRSATREGVSDDYCYAASDDAPEMIVAESHSEYGLRVSSGIDNGSATLARSVIKRLARVMTSELSREDLSLLAGVNRYIPLRKLAEEMNITHGAARVRLSRLRQRLAKAAFEHLDSLEMSDRREVLRFLTRAKVRVVHANSERSDSDGKGQTSGDSK